MRKIQVLAIIVLAVASALGKSYENKGYRFSIDSLPVTVAIAPIGHVIGESLDSFYAALYTDSGLTRITQPKEVRAILADDSVLLSTLTMVAEYKYSKEKLKAGPTIFDILDSGVVRTLQSNLGNVRLLLFPISFELSSSGIGTSGRVNFRLYDLASGVLIYEKDQQLFVEQGGDDGKMSIAAGLIAFSRDHYRKYFLSKLKK